jgi:hypothetical protein
MDPSITIAISAELPTKDQMAIRINLKKKLYFSVFFTKILAFFTIFASDLQYWYFSNGIIERKFQWFGSFWTTSKFL